MSSWTALQAVAALLTALGGFFTYLGYKTKRDRITGVGNAFASTVEALSSQNQVTRMAAAVLLRRFFDQEGEQAVRGTAPFRKEAIEVIAGMLREPQSPHLQKVLADGLRYAGDLQDSDLQNCDLTRAYLGEKERMGETENKGGFGVRSVNALARAGKSSHRAPRLPMLPGGGKAKKQNAAVDISRADLFEATCLGTSFKRVKAVGTVFYHSNLERAVLEHAQCMSADFREAILTKANCQNADFRNARFSKAKCAGADFRKTKLSGAEFVGAEIGGARFAGAEDIPQAVADLLDSEGTAVPGSTVPEAGGTP